MTIKVELNTKGRPPWKLAEATLIFTSEDHPLLAGLSLSGFTIGTSKFPDSVNVTVPSRRFLVKNTETGLSDERTWNYLRPTTADDKEALQKLLKAISVAYDEAVSATKD